VKTDTVRINRFLASCGLGSRRKCEELVEEGKVTINGEAALLTSTVNPEKDTVKVSGKRIKPRKVTYYVILNKPKGYITSVGDPFDRLTIRDIVDDKYWEAGVFPVGRLDKETEGLLLLTNDGDLAHRLMHPSFESKKRIL
jgi:23S rRNA pseudouridine2605 synthase